MIIGCYESNQIIKNINLIFEKYIDIIMKCKYKLNSLYKIFEFNFLKILLNCFDEIFRNARTETKKTEIKKNLFLKIKIYSSISDFFERYSFFNEKTHKISRLKHRTNDITSRDNFIDAKELNNFIRYFRFHVELLHVFPRRIILFSIVSLIAERPA